MRGDDPRADEGLVEAMARAWWDREQEVTWEGSGFEPVPWDVTNPSLRAEYRDYAQAALTAARSHGGM